MRRVQKYNQAITASAECVIGSPYFSRCSWALLISPCLPVCIINTAFLLQLLNLLSLLTCSAS
eukprot:4957241-Amphidinium_carterae.1